MARRFEFPPEGSALNVHPILPQSGDFNLPTEIFLTILEIVFQLNFDVGDGPPLTTATHVCSYWRRIAVNTPWFWNTISTEEYPFSWVVESFRRSKGTTVPLNVAIRIRGEETYQFAREVLEEIHRIESLVIRIPNRYFENLLPLLCKPAPLLIECGLCTNRTETDSAEDRITRYSLPQNIFGGVRTPSLRYLKFSGYRLYWNWPNMVNLYRFSVFQGNGTISLRALLDALQNSPRLKRFHLALSGQVEIADIPVQGSHKLFLPELDLSTIDVAAPLHLPLMTNITGLPADSGIEVTIRNFRINDNVIPEAFPWLEDSGDLNVYIGRKLELTIESIPNSSPRTQVCLKVRFLDDPLELSLNVIRQLPILSQATALTLTLSPWGNDHGAMMWEVLSDRLPNIQRLALKGIDEEDIMNMVTVLLADHIVRWPSLYKIRINQDWGDETISTYVTILEIFAQLRNIRGARAVNFKFRKTEEEALQRILMP